MEENEGGARDILRRFGVFASDLDPEDLRSLMARLTEFGHLDPLIPKRPQLRRPPRNEVTIHRVRIDLRGARPPIWRRLELRSDLTLDVVHRALQAAFGWLDYHLHRFALGGGVFDYDSELFLCPFDIEEGDDEGVAASEVRLDETLQDPGDVLNYVYDYGDSWELSIRLEEVLPVEGNPQTALCVDGRRAAPPEDCGHLTTAEELAQVIEDPAFFDIEEVNSALSGLYFVLHGAGVPSRLLELAYRFGPVGGLGEKLLSRLVVLADSTPTVTPDAKRAALGPFLWFLDRARGEGFELTAAGYLKPVDVEAASELLPTMRGWIGKNNREANLGPLLTFRETLQKLGLLRKYKGRLRLTRAGATVADDPDALWDYLAGKIVEVNEDRFHDEASLLLLADAATSPDGLLSLEDVAAALSHLGWVDSEGGPVGDFHLYRLEPNRLAILRNVGNPGSVELGETRISREATALARSALTSTHSE